MLRLARTQRIEWRFGSREDTSPVRTRGLVGLGLLLLALAGLPPAARAQGPALTLPATANQLLYVPGETLRLSVAAQNPGLPTLADFYVAVLLPDQVTLVALGPGGTVTLGSVDALAALPPVAAAVDLSIPFAVDFSPFFERAWTGDEPEGLYRVFVGAVTPGALADGVLAPAEILTLNEIAFLFTKPFTPTLEPGQAASALITPAGGTVTATGTNGVTYTLDVPPGALSTDTTLTLTPVAALAGFPPGALLAAVRAEPEGLEFLVPLTLAMTLPGGLPAGGLVGLAARGDGAQVQIVPTAVSGLTVTLSTRHFSVFGAGLAVPVTQFALLEGSRPFPLSPRGDQCIVALIDELPAVEIEAACLPWYDQEMRPLLQQGTVSDEVLPRGLWLFFSWNAVAQQAPTSQVLQRQTEGLDLAVGGLSAAIDRANDACTADRKLAFAAVALQLQELARAYFPPTFDLEGAGLDRATVLENLCVRVKLTSTSLPPPPYPAGQPLTLQAQAQLEFPSSLAGPLFTPIEIVLNGQGVAEADAIGFVTQAPADSQGAFATMVTPNGQGPVVLRVRARVDEPSLPGLQDVFAEAILGQLAVSPSSATVAPGTGQQFTASFNGQPHAVTWSVSGAVATITPGGRFEASTPPSFPVIVVVTATSTTHPNLTGTATVTIDNTPASLRVSGQASVEDRAGDCTDSSGNVLTTSFPVTVSATCQGSNVQLTVTRSGNTLTFTGSAGATLGPAGFAEATLVIVPTAGHSFAGSATLSPVTPTLTGADLSCEVKVYASGGGLNVFYIQKTGATATSQLSDSVQLSPSEGMNLQIQIDCDGTGSASLSGVSFTMTLSPL